MDALKDWLSKNWHKFLGSVVPPDNTVKYEDSFESGVQISENDTPKDAVKESAQTFKVDQEHDQIPRKKQKIGHTEDFVTPCQA